MTVGFYFDQQSCIGCRTCQVACKDRHDIHEPGIRPRRVESYETGTYPDAGMFHTTVSCNHCENPACTANCPTRAMYKAEDGTVIHDDSKCIQCKMCMLSCPYGAPQWDFVEDVIVKCDGCKDLRDAGMSPNCVAACPMRALDFGEIDDLKAKYGDELVSEIPAMPSDDLTSPNALINPTEFATRDDFNWVTL